MKTILLVDGDCLMYLSFPYAIVDGPKLYDNSGQRILEERTQEEIISLSMIGYENFKKSLEKLQETLFADEVLVAVKGEGNFRDEIFPGYKANRSNRKSNMMALISRLRQLLVMEETAMAADGCEADDLLGIWATELRSYGHNPIVCTIDKDLVNVSKMYYNLKTGTLKEVSDQESTRHFYTQLLSGDIVDCIPGLPGIGEKRAATIMQHLKTEEEMQEAVVDMYMRIHGDEWRDRLLSNGKLLKIQTAVNEYFTISNWNVIKEIS